MSFLPAGERRGWRMIPSLIELSDMSSQSIGERTVMAAAVHRDGGGGGGTGVGRDM